MSDLKVNALCALVIGVVAFSSADALAAIDGTGLRAIDGTGIRAIDGTGLRAIDGTGIRAIDGTGLRAIDGTGLRAIDGTGLRAIDGTGLRAIDGTGIRAIDGTGVSGYAPISAITNGQATILGLAINMRASDEIDADALAVGDMVYFEAMPGADGVFDLTGGYQSDEQFVPGSTSVMLTGAAVNNAVLGTASIGDTTVDYTQALGNQSFGESLAEVAFFGVMDHVSGSMFANDLQILDK